MLRRDRQIRTQISQLADAFLVAVSFWLAFVLRADPQHRRVAGARPNSRRHVEQGRCSYPGGNDFRGLSAGIAGFLRSPRSLGPRRATLWPLFKGCLLTTIVLILATFLFQKELVPSRIVMTFFGVISFALIYCKEEAAPAGVQKQIRARPIQTPLHPRRHGARNRPHVPANWRGEGRNHRRRGAIQSGRQPAAATRPTAPRPRHQRRDFERQAHLFRAD